MTESIIRKKSKVPDVISKEWIINQLEKLVLNKNQILNKTIDYRDKFDFDEPYSYYMKQIYNTYNLDNFEPELEFCDTYEQKRTWLYLRLKISSFEYHNSKGRNIKILVRDKTTQKYVGIASLGSEVGNGLLDKYIGWTSNDKFNEKMFNHIMNITTCVGIPPFCFNFNGGKLIAMLMFSKEVSEYFRKKYNERLMCITTLSLHGKSVQYDRIKELKYIGLTKGKGISHIPNWLYEAIVKYMEQNNINKKFRNRLGRISYLASKLKVTYLVKSGFQRGVYVGFTGKNTREYLTGKENMFVPLKLKTVRQIGEFWKERWATQRLNNILDTKRLMIKCDYDNAIVDEKDYNRLKQIRKTNKNPKDNKKEVLNYEEKIEIIKYHIDNKKISMLGLQKYFSKKFNKKIDRRTISNILI